MRTKVLIPCVGLVVAVVALSVLVESAQSRALTQDEMRQTLGKIGDGCPCHHTSGWKTDCSDRDNCGVCHHAYPPATPAACPTTTQKVGGYFEYRVCEGGNPNDWTCYGPDEDKRKCYSYWTCKEKGVYLNCKCAALGKIDVCGDWGDKSAGWVCRQCEKNVEQETPAPVYITPQICLPPP